MTGGSEMGGGGGAQKQKEGDSKTNLAEIWRMLFCLLVSG